MQVSVETVSELGRKMTIQVPEDQVRVRVDNQLSILNKKVKIDGFRPGKVPPNVIKQRYGAGVIQEVIQEIIQSGFKEAMQGESLTLVSPPDIEMDDSQPDGEIRYVVTFEVMPQIGFTQLEKMSVPRYVTEVPESEIDAIILKLRKNHQTWEEVDRPAQMGDRLLINIAGYVDSQDLSPSKVKNLQLVLGSGLTPCDCESKLVGAMPGESRNFDITFPDDYAQTHLAGKTEAYTVDVLTVSAPILPELDQAFFQTCRVDAENYEAFRTTLKNNVARQIRLRLKKKNRDALKKLLLDVYTNTPLPQILIDAEADNIIKRTNHDRQPDLSKADERKLKKIVEPMAREVTLMSCIMRQVITDEDLKPDDALVRLAVEDYAAGYENPEKTVDWLYSNPEQISRFESLVLEDQVFDLLISKANVYEESVDYLSLIEAAPQAD